MPTWTPISAGRHTSASSALELVALTRHFGPNAKRVTALDDVSLALGPGRIVGLVGRNGAGKTTLLRCATGLLRPTAGCVRVMGHDLERHAHVITREIGFLGAEDRSFPPRLTALASLCLYGGLRGLTRRDSLRRAHARAEEIDAADLLQRPFQSLSSGQRQRIGLLRAVLHDPRVLLLDEPTQALDASGSRFVLELARREADKGALVVISSHDLPGIEAAADELVVLEQGCVLTSGPRAHVLPPLSIPGWRVAFQSSDQRATAADQYNQLQPSPDATKALIDDERDGFPRALQQLMRNTDAGLVSLERRTRMSLEELVVTIAAHAVSHEPDGQQAAAAASTVATGDAADRSREPQTPGVIAPTPGVLAPTQRAQRQPSRLRALLAIVRRDFQVQLSYRFRLFVQLGLLCVWAGMFHYLALLIGSDDPDVQGALHGNPFGFLLLGLATLEISQVCTTHMARTLREEQLMGTFEPLVATGRSPLLVLIGSIGCPLVTSVMLLVGVLYLAALGLGADFTHTNVLATMATLGAGCVVMSALGVMSAAFVHAFKRGDPVATMLNLASLVAAGAYFPRQLLPEAVQHATAWLPHTTALAALRAAVLAGAGFDDPYFLDPFLVLLVSGAVLAPIAAIVWRIAHHYARSRGSLADA